MDDWEHRRLEAVHRHHILDTSPDPTLDRLTAAAAHALQVPIAYLSIVDRDRVWFKSRHGLDIPQVGMEPGFCASCVRQSQVWLVEDAGIDAAARTHPFVAGQGLKFYLGIPLRTRDGVNIGALAVMDRAPRAPSRQDIARLSDLASVVMAQLELRLDAREALERCTEERAKRRRREEHIQALLRELAHRSKNLLAVVLAIARQTASRTQTRQAYAANLCARVQGLAYTHDLIAEDDWQGAGIADLAMRQLGPFLDLDAPRIELAGPPLTLTPVAAQNIGLALHELATNAVKYGALGGPQGRIALRWDLVGAPEAPSLLRATWQEQGGPAPKPSTFKGFGRIVLDRIVPEALGGQARLDLAPDGARWTIEVPAVHVRTI